MGFNWLGGKTPFLFSPLFWMYFFCFHKFIWQKLCFRRSQLLFMSSSTLWYIFSLEAISKNMVRDGVWRHAMLRGMEGSAALCAVWRRKVGRQAVDSISQSPHHFEIGRSTVGGRSSFLDWRWICWKNKHFQKIHIPQDSHFWDQIDWIWLNQSDVNLFITSFDIFLHLCWSVSNALSGRHPESCGLSRQALNRVCWVKLWVSLKIKDFGTLDCGDGNGSI